MTWMVTPRGDRGFGDRKIIPLSFLAGIEVDVIGFAIRLVGHKRIGRKDRGHAAVMHPSIAPLSMPRVLVGCRTEFFLSV